MRRQLVPGPVVRLTVIKAKTRPGIEASSYLALAGIDMSQYNYIAVHALNNFHFQHHIVTHTTQNIFHAEPEIQNQQKSKISKKIWR